MEETVGLFGECEVHLIERKIKTSKWHGTENCIHVNIMYLFNPSASSCAGRWVWRHWHSPLGTSHFCYLRQTARGKRWLTQPNSIQKFTALLFSALRKQLLPLAWVSTQTQTVGGCHLVRARKAKSGTGLFSQNTDTSSLSWSQPNGKNIEATRKDITCKHGKGSRLERVQWRLCMLPFYWC